MAPDECPVSLPIHQTQLESRKTDPLRVIINDTSLVLTPAKIKGFIVMTTGPGLYLLHSEILCEYDLKPNNLLLDENGLLRLSDFGLTKTLGRPTVYTHQVVTCRWCCSPELLFGARMYGVGVDMWAMGCILVELLQVHTHHKLKHIFSAAGDDLLERLQGLFTFNPSTRLTATQPLRVRYFTNRPGLIPGPQLPQHNSSAEPLKSESRGKEMVWRQGMNNIHRHTHTSALESIAQTTLFHHTPELEG
uniref:[RNA-polymerase]-subunit kinase n=1 Tax=Hucho hucho TaxID=62062 RepID=A0A4W5KVH3_9TELE